MLLKSRTEDALKHDEEDEVGDGEDGVGDEDLHLDPANEGATEGALEVALEVVLLLLTSSRSPYLQT